MPEPHYRSIKFKRQARYNSSIDSIPNLIKALYLNETKSLFKKLN